MASIATAHGRIGVAQSGGGETPIVFLHGVGSDKSVWHPQLDHFGRERLAIAFDYPGYGESGLATPGTSRDDYAAAIIEALRQLDVKRAHICGLSLGGVIAVALHSAAPQLCASLILADTFAVHPDGCGIYERSVAGSADMRAFAEARVDFLLAQPADDTVRREVIETMAGIDPAAYVIGAEAVWLADQRQRARAIAVPTLILCGDDDKPTPPDLSRELGALISGSQLAMIAGAGHLTNLERPVEFNRLVGDFIASL
ncbi:alpha/beta fold hydrolase [Sphingomonas sinipercae]|uniref:Alpha/beta fold hydrolase n=1 Tax=Sphingomonas sinipercae TaxID=2714944 RepID=A0A6G7ZLP0_9SPHN|nr:alpha/beta fold hydrolase [Sphingomonas sinipercae]QIL01838.1 alpha/beta fold hydrolase [Sphingomonas sinipercae]